MIRVLPACLPECFLGLSLLLSGCEIIPSASSDGKSLTGGLLPRMMRLSLTHT